MCIVYLNTACLHNKQDAIHLNIIVSLLTHKNKKLNLYNGMVVKYIKKIY